MINQQGFYGLASGVTTTILLQPFENIKMALMLPPHKLKQLHQNNNFFNNIISSCRYINQKDGFRGYYKGLVAASIKVAVGCYLYFTGLRWFEKKQMSPFDNFYASSISRLVSTFLTNPMSVIETRFQLAFFHGYNSVWAAATDIYRKEGFKSFFSGCLSSCIKEGTFGGFHYMFYQQFKAYGMNMVLAGITSGMLATSITHPFEIIRARLQTQGLYQQHSFKQHQIFDQLRHFWVTGGWFRGLAPRLIKKPVANMLTFLFFQIIENKRSDRKNVK